MADPGPVGNITKNITSGFILLTWMSPDTPNGIITAYTVQYNITVAVTTNVPGTNLTISNVTNQKESIITRVTSVILNGITGNVTYSVCVAARTRVGYGPCSNTVTFTTSKLIDSINNSVGQNLRPVVL